uniref:Uncharacterized protein n=1 Tax=Micrurus lemniscatus lemniscatus TaxID=129467 RepID=A0A2D4INY6_MICLE
MNFLGHIFTQEPLKGVPKIKMATPNHVIVAILTFFDDNPCVSKCMVVLSTFASVCLRPCIAAENHSYLNIFFCFLILKERPFYPGRQFVYSTSKGHLKNNTSFQFSYFYDSVQKRELQNRATFAAVYQSSTSKQFVSRIIIIIIIFRYVFGGSKRRM